VPGLVLGLEARQHLPGHPPRLTDPGGHRPHPLRLLPTPNAANAAKTPQAAAGYCGYCPVTISEEDLATLLEEEEIPGAPDPLRLSRL